MAAEQSELNRITKLPGVGREYAVAGPFLGAEKWTIGALSLTFAGAGLYVGGKMLENRISGTITDRMKTSGKVLIAAGVPLTILCAIGANNSAVSETAYDPMAYDLGVGD